MDYMPWNACLLIKPTLESSSGSDTAAWVQAVGSVLAILVAVGVAWYQARKQQELNRETLWQQYSMSLVKSAETFAEIASAASKVLKRISSQLDSRTKVLAAAEDRLPFDMPELRRFERALDGVELHLLPGQLVTPALILSANVRQFRVKVEMALQHCRSMDAAAFDDLFSTLNAMNQSTAQSVQDFYEKVTEIIHTYPSREKPTPPRST
ncbi:hypothetical protein OI25_3416 [Paraburkholderia fungorum]|uniref:LemA protein n=1 Tax=Paraburkholderia fungorum TaxID=134537 RepID=A0AAU8TG35_9BURK|nr:hypothetical protein [Paraburkholderia fungorum]AJZ59451.1 hypothetical protein OI25_3416 [Paraburkholderia fungorum]